jgi:hypothetical protein
VSSGCLFYNHGTRCLVRLLVSLHSLRRHYQGPVAIACEGTPPEWFSKPAAKMKAEIISAPVSNEYGLVKKSRVWRVSPFDTTLFLDADTLIRSPVDFLLTKIQEHGLLATQFNDWHTYRGRMRRRIDQWQRVAGGLLPAVYDYRHAINTGIFGWKRGNPAMPDYEAMTAKGLAPGIGRKTLDEIALQLILPRHKHFLAGSEWNCGCVHSDGRKAKIVHYHGHKHCRDEYNSDLWKEEFWSVCRDFPEIQSKLIADPEDKSVARWLKRDFTRRKDLTIVTAVNPAYAARAERSIKLWMATPGLREQRFIVFVRGFKNASERTFLELPNVEVIRWKYDFPCSDREAMLASFVLGAAEHVKTEYWMKLDADTVPLRPYWRWPEYKGKAYTSHRWGYTKMKADPGAQKHWFNVLDEFFAPAESLFKRKLDPIADFKVTHRKGNPDGIPMRCASFAHIEQTAFTKRISAMVRKSGGRLPIPSHDTLVWHAATAWKLPTTLMNMREWFEA